jgi:cytochrome P450
MIMVCAHTIHFDSRNYPEPSTFLPDRHLDSYEPKIDRNIWRSFERGMRACLGQDLAMEKMRVILLLTVRWFDFETITKPSKTQRVGFTNMDLKLGDQAFQVLRMSAGPRDGMKMRIKSTGRI